MDLQKRIDLTTRNTAEIVTPEEISILENGEEIPMSMASTAGFISL